MFLQTTGIPDQSRRERMRASGWISKYMFPGGVLPALVEIRETVRDRGHAFVVCSVREIGPHYVRTLDEWRKRFWRTEANVRTQALTTGLSGCEAAFKLHKVRDIQLVMERSTARIP